MTKLTHLLIKIGRGLRTIRKLIRVQNTTKTINEDIKTPLKRVEMTEKNGLDFVHLRDTDIAMLILTQMLSTI